jgi:peptide/nickel transport system permease protein
MTTRWAAALSLIWLFVILVVSFVGPALSGWSPLQPVADPLISPNSHHPLGTDALGRDLLTRMMYGARYSPGLSLLALLITVILGGVAGLTAAMLEGWVDRLIVWLANAMLAIPGLLLAMLFVAGLGPGLPTVILAVGLGGVPGFTRLARTLFMQLRVRGYVEAAMAVGASRQRIALRHILPNAQGQLLSLATTHFAWAFMGITTLTFLGFAGDPSIPEWGAILNAARTHIIDTPRLALWPGLAISLTIMAVHHLGAWLSNSVTHNQTR